MLPKSDDNFDFLTEIQKKNIYRLLYPDEIAGLAIIWLHNGILNNTFPNRVFKESDIHTALEVVSAKSDGKDKNTPWERYNIIISDLQEYFLRYDDEKRVYAFKEYAYDFCNRAFEILKANFDPTKIEKICVDLRRRLENAKEEREFKYWFEIEFDLFKPQLKNQIDFLDRQIDKSVSELRFKTNSPEAKITEKLKDIDIQFEKVRKQNIELRAAFKEIDNIKEILETKVLREENQEIGNRVFEAISFFREMNYTLNLIDVRLDRVQPKIKQLFSTLNRPFFNARVETFLRFLLEKSTVDSDASKKRLIFPGNIPPPIMHGTVPNFTIFERRKELFPAQRKDRVRYQENDKNRENAFNLSRTKIEQQDKITKLIEEIEYELEKKGELSFAPIFFGVLKENENGFDLAVNLAHRLIYESNIRDSWSISISDNIVASKLFNHIALCNMNLIYRKRKIGIS